MSENGKRSVLVVDDDPDFAAYLRMIFEDAGHSVTTARDGEQALSHMWRSPPDLVTLDVDMPRRTGVLLYRRMKTDARLRSIPVIVISGMPLMGDYFVSRFPAAPERVFEKPVDKDGLIAAVRELLAEKASEARE